MCAISFFPHPTHVHRGLKKNRYQSGAALVLVLAMLVMMLVLIMAFFSHATLQRQISASSAAGIQADFLSQTATDIILSDILHEIQAGSDPDPLAGNVESPVYQPLLVESNSVLTAPSLRLQKAGNPTATNILKISRAQTPFFTTGAGYRNVPDLGAEGADRASQISTESPAFGGRRLTKDRWFLPQLLQTTETNSFTSPDWIYLDRAGKNPTTFDPDALKDYADKNPSNLAYVIGRFAYVIYDEGGLLDINVAGNLLGTAENARRGRLHQIPLTHIGSLSLPQATSFIAWRDAGEPSDPASDGGLFDSKRTFLQVPFGSQAFISRQDLIRYANQSNSSLPPQALPFLTTFSRDRNAPHYEPDIPLSTPADLEAEDFNPPLLSVRFPTETTLHRPEGDVTVPSGTPVVVRRFPLGKIDLLAEDTPDPDALKYYFGLEKDGNAFKYTAHIGGRIAKLSEIAALGREPNFFELLQATILTGSLGRNAGNTYTYDNDRDSARNLQIIQIGANIIDQWDEDDFPTTIEYPSGNPGAWESFYGVENLPYINNIRLTAHRPAFDRSRFQIWAWFDVWNPHQNAKTAPKDIEAFRIIPVQGQIRTALSYFVWLPDKTPAGNFVLNNGETFGGYSGPQQDIVALNINALAQTGGPGTTRFSWFDGKGDYSEPTILGTMQPPGSATDYPTMLFTDFTGVGPAVSEVEIINGEHIRRDPQGKNIQPYINELVGLYPVECPLPTNGSSNANWDVRQDSDGNPILDSDGNPIYDAKFGVKTQNIYRLIPVSGGDVILELQANIKGSWRTYQVFDGFLPLDNGLGVSLGVGGASMIDTREDAPSMFKTDTHFSKLDETSVFLQSRFYEWEDVTNPASSNTSINLFKADPRTIRFGHSNSAPPTLGRTIRMTTAPFPPSPTEDGIAQNDWSFTYGDRLPQDLTVFERKPRKNTGAAAAHYAWPFGFLSNTPEGNIDVANPAFSRNPMRYSDRDKTIRPGDAYVGSGNDTGAYPTVPGRMDDRPLILNRPFRSVGEMGYAFRDLPWKTLDFFSSQSGDLGLLDVFTVDETPGPIPLIAGKVDLNTPHAEVLSAMLEGTTKNAYKLVESLPTPKEITATEADDLAAEIVKESTKAPFRDRGDLVRRLLAPLTASDPGIWQPVIKTERESAIRTLSEIGTVRTWNLMIDLVVQSGQFTPASQTGADFVVRAQRRIWVHLAIDRFTGEILDRQVEVVHE